MRRNPNHYSSSAPIGTFPLAHVRSAVFQESVAVAIARAVGEFFNRRQLATTPAVGAAVTPAPVRSPGATPSPGR